MGDQPISHRVIEKDGRIGDPGATYHGGLIVAAAGGAGAFAVYDGIDNSGDLIDSLYAAAGLRDSHWFGEGITLRRGLYVDLNAYVAAGCIYYKPTPREKG